MPEITRLEEFIRSRGIKPAHLARESGFSRQHLGRIRKGRMEPTRRCIAAVVGAMRRLAAEPVRAGDLFEVGEDAPSLPHRLDAATVIFYRILGRLGVPIAFLAASLRPAPTRFAACLLVGKLSPVRIRELIEQAAREERFDAETQQTLFQMFDGLRRRIVEVNSPARDLRKAAEVLDTRGTCDSSNT